MGQNASKPSPDAKLISTVRDGDSLVSRWLVMDRNDDGTTEFTLHYQMNLTKLVSSYDRNSDELKSLHSLLDEVASDAYKTITSINIVGYASPDGTQAINQRLSMARANDFRAYINKSYNLASVRGTTQGKALTWSDALSSVRSSSIPSKSEVLSIMSSSNSSTIKEQKLKAMPSSWSYLCKDILPKMRSVEMHLKYNSWREVVTRSAITASSNRSSVPTFNITYILVEDRPTDMIIFDNDYCTLLDYPECDEYGRYHKSDKRSRPKKKGFVQKYKERTNNRGYRAKYLYTR